MKKMYFILLCLLFLSSCSGTNDDLQSSETVVGNSQLTARINDTITLQSVQANKLITAYYSKVRNQHYYSSNGHYHPSYFKERDLGFTRPSNYGAVISSWYNESNGDLLLTTNPNEVQGKRGWSKKEDIGYSYSGNGDGGWPVYRYYRSSSRSHFYTMEWDELGNGKNGFVYEGISFYLRRW